MQAHGDYAAREGAARKRASSGPRCRSVLDKLDDVPVDIAPQFTTAAALEQQFP